MADIVLGMYLFPLFQPHVATGMRANCPHSLPFNVRQEGSLCRSCPVAREVAFTSSLVILPYFQRIICSLRVL